MLKNQSLELEKYAKTGFHAIRTKKMKTQEVSNDFGVRPAPHDEERNHLVSRIMNVSAEERIQIKVTNKQHGYSGLYYREYLHANLYH